MFEFVKEKRFLISKGDNET